MDNKYKPIGFFDSGIGGISILKKARQIMPNEDFFYFGDSKNAPYGTKDVQMVKKLTFEAMDFLLENKVKAVVIACNTATSASINDLRKTYKDIPIIGIEPALKPAVELNRQGKIIIMATPMTLLEDKFNKLMLKYEDKADIVPMPCAGLVELIENGIIEGDELNSFLKEKFSHISHDDIAAIVLGCTHYPFIKGELSKVVGDDIPIIDGSYGTAKQLKKQLIDYNILNDKISKGNVTIINSLNNNSIKDLSYKLINI